MTYALPRKVVKTLRGFTLIEMAVVIAIIGALLGTLLVPLATQIDASKVRATDREMKDIREALLGYAMANGRLPCPDHDLDGVEDQANQPQPLCTGPYATVQECFDPGAGLVDYDGFLPFATLGVGATDSWGRRYRYAVTRQFALAALPGVVGNEVCRLDKDDTGDMTINDRGDNPATVGLETKTTQSLGINVPAVVVSYGANGIQGTVAQTNAIIADPDPTLDEVRDERSNYAPGSPPATATTFVFRNQSIDGNPCDDADETLPFCGFDDRVVWLSSSVIINRLVTAGVLP